MQVQVKRITSFTGHSGAVYSLDKGEDDHLIFSGSSDKFLALWNLKTLQAEKIAERGQHRTLRDHTYDVRSTQLLEIIHKAMK